MSSATSNLYRFGELVLDVQNRVLKRAGEPVPLTRKAFDVLLLLVQNSGSIVTKEELMNEVWPDSFVEDSNLTQTIFMIRKALNETADRRYILTLQGQGYRFLAPVTEAETSVTEAEKPQLTSAGVEDSKKQSPFRLQRRGLRRWVFLGCAGATLIAMAAAGLRYWHARQAPSDRPNRITLAVLPFENFTGDERQEYFSDGMTEEMISQLGNLDPARLGVIARTSIMHYKHSQASITDIGRELGVQYVIEGSVRREAGRVRIAAQLIQVKDQSHVWAQEYDRDLSHLLELQREIAREVANEIEFRLSGRRPIEPFRPAAPASGANFYEAYDLYLKGRYFWNKRTPEGFRQAAEYFQQAIEKDPNNGRAYAGLADTFSLMSTWYVGPQDEFMPKARTAALRALALDDSLAEAHASLALIKENYDYAWTEAESQFRRAIQLDPQYATAHQWYAEFLSWQGRFPEAFAESELARQLDPLSPIIASDHASILYYSRNYESALKECQSVLEFDPNFDHARVLMARFYLQMGNNSALFDLIHFWETNAESHNQDPWLWAWKAAAFGRSGQMDQSRRALGELDQISKFRVDRDALLLLADSGRGEEEQVIDLLQKAYLEHSNSVMPIKVEPLYDPIRNDPRFQDLLKRAGFQR